MQTYDKLWKGIVEDLFEDFLDFFYPDLVPLIDFEKGFDFLDQELTQIFPDAEKDNRAVDKLVKVYLKNGKEEWLLIHIEVQGYEDDTFELRMFTYYYRILDRYQKEITALAIFTDKRKKYKPNTYRRDFQGTKLTYEFNTYKVLEQSKSKLMASENPFALVILATLATIEKKKLDDDAIMSIKWILVRLMFERNYSREKITALFKFIQHYIRFEKSENYAIFAKDFLNIYQPNQKSMGVVDILIEDARQEGIDLGIEKGIDLGIEKGIYLGIEQKTIDVVENILSEFPEWDDEKIANLAATTVELVAHIRIKNKDK